MQKGVNSDQQTTFKISRDNTGSVRIELNLRTCSILTRIFLPKPLSSEITHDIFRKLMYYLSAHGQLSSLYKM